jgi:hypothetical protein
MIDPALAVVAPRETSLQQRGEIPPQRPGAWRPVRVDAGLQALKAVPALVDRGQQPQEESDLGRLLDASQYQARGGLSPKKRLQAETLSKTERRAVL